MELENIHEKVEEEKCATFVITVSNKVTVVVVFHDTCLTLWNPELHFEDENLLHEACELSAIFCLLGLELGHIQDFRNSTPPVSIILVLMSCQ